MEREADSRPSNSSSSSSTGSLPPYPLEDMDLAPTLGREYSITPEDPYAFLEHFDTAFLIDDSAAMEKYWGEVSALLGSIAPICTERDPDGIDIYFVNHHPRGYYMYAALGLDQDRSGYKHIGQATGSLAMCDNVAGIFNRVKPHGKCKLGHRLSYILNRYVRDYAWSAQRAGHTGPIVKPLNLIVISAGDTDDNPNDTLIHTAKKLDELEAPEYQLGIQFFQIGDSEAGRQAMEFADDTLAEAMGFRDMIDTVTWSGDKPGELTPEAVLKVVLGAVHRSIDKHTNKHG
ncbi:hypothetical protein F4677DRAFT_457424 [Hypoxylon crocopeplum]|nr:hypothetical protein F4677DRAFT_457424 [Hypoxylon crocopeplum]